MGTWTINISAMTVPSYVITNDIVSDCFTSRTITVDHNGTDKHVGIVSLGDGANMTVSEVITADKAYNLEIVGATNTANPNTFNGTIVLTIRELNATGAVIATVVTTRDHSNNFC